MLLRLALASAAANSLACGGDGRGRVEMAPTPDPAAVAEGIFARYAEAVGGQEAADRVTAYAMRGSLLVPGKGVSLPVELYVKKPDKSLMVIDVPGLGRIRRGKSGGRAWVQTPHSAVAEEGGTGELSEVERDHDLYKAGRIRELYREVRLESKGRLKGRDVYVVEGKPAEGPAEKMLFDAETGLLLRWDIVRRRAGGANVFAKVSLEDYREVGGVKVPFTVRYFFEPRELVLRLDEVRHDAPLDDAIFEGPRGR